MAKFFKSLLLTVIGSIITAIFIVLIFVAIIAGIAASGDKVVKVEENTLLTIDLDKVIKERTVSDPLAELFGESPFGQKEIGLNIILENIKKAKRDDKIVGIYLKAGVPQAGYATLNEIRNALIDFKKSGKFIYAFAPIYTQKGYYLASTATKVYMPPQGLLEYKGLSSQRTYFKGALESLGIEMQIFKHGKFKSAVEPFILDHMSEPAKEQTIKYTGSIWNHVLNGISDSRGVSVDSLNILADQMPMFSENKIFEDYNLVDGLLYKDEVLAEVKELTDTELEEDIVQVSLTDYDFVYLPKETKGLVKDKIAVIYAEGEIDGGSDKGIDSEKLSKTIRDARTDKSIKAVVLRINSPGGSGMGSDIIWREVKLCKETKPVIVSMGDLAASGGYYIACAADTIVANPVTLTGSIGVFGMIPNMKKLMNKKLGITFDGVKTNKFADIPTVTRPFNKEEKAVFQASVERFYDVFISRCAEGRNTSTQAIDEVGQGRVWSGENAVDLNLVDVMGGIDTAIEIASEKAGLENYRIKELPEQLSPLEEILKGMQNEAKAFVGQTFLGINYEEVKLINSVKQIKPIQARLPYELELN
ncbi:signal peptide peptidase SppA [Labilibacter sediminis]|nr:signal peptide peptidase SppA [Labilibacter sediminis]